MELKRIIISEIHEQQVIALKEVDGDRSFPIVIGIFEATSIDRRVKGITNPRPLTHDLVASTIESMGGELQERLHQRPARAHLFRQATGPAGGRAGRDRLPAERRDRVGSDGEGADLRRRGRAGRSLERVKPNQPQMHTDEHS